MRDSHSTSPLTFFFLVLPMGISAGYVGVTMPFILTRAGFSVGAAAAIVAAVFPAEAHPDSSGSSGRSHDDGLHLPGGGHARCASDRRVDGAHRCGRKEGTSVWLVSGGEPRRFWAWRGRGRVARGPLLEPGCRHAARAGDALVCRRAFFCSGRAANTWRTAWSENARHREGLSRFCPLAHRASHHCSGELSDRCGGSLKSLVCDCARLARLPRY